MHGDIKELATSMLRQYGEAAESVAKDYAKKFERAGQRVDQGYWLRVAGFIARQRYRV
jgi:hypothetical protein